MNSSTLRHLLFKDKFSDNSLKFSYNLGNLGFYGNVCRECFKSTSALKKCSSCKIVSYCSKEHQIADWPVHKLFCKAYKVATEKVGVLTPFCLFEDFSNHKKNLGVEIRKNISSVLFVHVKEMYSEIYEFLWVCSVCFSGENLDYECGDCKSVVYCSLEHMNQNKVNHKINCFNLKLCKLFDSLSYENGYELKLIKFKFETVPRKLKYFPQTIHEMSCLIQKQLSKTETINDNMNLILHNDLYAFAATILYAFNSIGLLHNRVMAGKPFLTKLKRKLLLAERMAQVIAFQIQGIPENKIDPAMVIHFVGANAYEAQFHWTHFIGILTHWMLNIDYIENILVGQGLEDCEEPDFRDLIARSGFQVHAEAYKNIVKHLPKPDLVVLYNFDLKNSSDEINDHQFHRALFKYKRIPVLITATEQTKLTSYVEKLMNLPNVQVQLDTHKNPFADSRPFRRWNEKCISTYVKNDFIAVLTRH